MSLLRHIFQIYGFWKTEYIWATSSSPFPTSVYIGLFLIASSILSAFSLLSFPIHLNIINCLIWIMSQLWISESFQLFLVTVFLSFQFYYFAHYLVLRVFLLWIFCINIISNPCQSSVSFLFEYLICLTPKFLKCTEYHRKKVANNWENKELNLVKETQFQTFTFGKFYWNQIYNYFV